jgi:thiosulfate/3-mercaptopyruvate sulfurtransferase
MEKNVNADPIIEPAALGAAGPLRLLDVRDAAAFSVSHAAGAVRVPIEEWEAAAKAVGTSMDNTAYWEETINKLGMDDTVLAVVYDDGRMTEAARVWFILQYFGARVAILNGGWPALSKVSIPASSVASSSKGFHAQPGSGRVGLVDREKLLMDNRLREGSELRELLRNAGFQPGDHIVTHCDGGGRAALAAAAAVRAGYEDVRAYYLSFADWARDESCPIERG